MNETSAVTMSCCKRLLNLFCGKQSLVKERRVWRDVAVGKWVWAVVVPGVLPFLPVKAKGSSERRQDKEQEQ
jgi:hypothetical protein